MLEKLFSFPYQGLNGTVKIAETFALLKVVRFLNAVTKMKVKNLIKIITSENEV